MFRAWLRPERTGLESKFGSKADAEEHSEAALTDSELIHFDVCEHLNRGVVDELLAYNFGPVAVGSVTIRADAVTAGELHGADGAAHEDLGAIRSSWRASSQRRIWMRCLR